MKKGSYLIVTNNPMVNFCMGSDYAVRFLNDKSLREVLIYVRDMVYDGYTLYTHPLSGSIKPNETPYKSILLSGEKQQFSPDAAQMMADAVTTCDKFSQKEISLSDAVKRDFQLLDYTLLSSALDFDTEAGISKYTAEMKKGGLSN